VVEVEHSTFVFLRDGETGENPLAGAGEKPLGDKREVRAVKVKK
jgi:hypothetical protein